MSSHNHMLSFFIFMPVIVIALSCHRSQEIKLVEPKHTFSRYGRVENKPIPGQAKKVVSYNIVSLLNYTFKRTPTGKIDSIIKANPDWYFIYYIKCEEADSLYVMNILNKYDCDFEVVLDFDGEFESKNFPNSHLATIGYICGPDNKVHGVSLIGCSQSFFDSEFEKVKRILR